jgi:hypothetical protein
MTSARGRLWWLVVLPVFVVAIAGCGSDSTGENSPRAVVNTVQSFAPGPDAKIYRSQMIVQGAEGGDLLTLPMVVACKPEGDCLLVAPDGAGYPDVATFVDDTKLLEPGDRALGNANITDPGAPVRSETFTKSADLTWLWYVGGGVLVLLAAAVWLVIRMRRRREDNERLLRDWETES